MRRMVETFYTTRAETSWPNDLYEHTDFEVDYTVVQRSRGGVQMEKKSNDLNGKQESHVRHGGDAHQSHQKEPKGPVQGFSQAPKGLQ